MSLPFLGTGGFSENSLLEQRVECTLVRPHLEYGNPAWFPRLVRQSTSIARVQRRATKLIYEIKDYTYEERLRYLTLPTLKARRKRGDLIQAYIIFNDIDDTNKDFFFKSPQTNIVVTRNSTDKIQKERHDNNNTRKFAFSYRVTNDWNKLTTNIKRAPSTNAFKNLIDKHNAGHDSRCNSHSRCTSLQ